MSEGILRHLAGDRFEAFSAGIEPAPEVNSLAVEVMKEIGIDISNQYPKHVKEFLDRDFDYVITTCDNARKACPIFPKKTVNIHWAIEDPAKAKGTKEEQLKIFKKTRDLIYEKIKIFLEESGD